MNSTIRRRLVAASLPLCCLLCARPALADGSIDVSTTLTTVRSPFNTYGPWVTTDVSLRLPPAGETGFEFTNRRASDRLRPLTNNFVELNNYHKFSRRLSTYAAVGVGSGPPFPRTRFAAEADITITKHLGIAIGGSTAQDYLIGGLRQARVGLDYFFGDNYASVRYIPTWSTLLGGSPGYSLAVGLGVPGKTTETLRLGAGSERDASLINPLNPSIVGEFEIGGGLSLKHWTAKNRGYHVDLGYGKLDRMAGGTIYSALSVGAGFFFGLR